MTEEMNIGDLEYVQSGGPNAEEVTKLDGCRAKIAECTIIDDISPVYDKKTSMIIEGQEQKVKKIELVTEEFGENLIGRNIVVKAKYKLQNKDGKWTVSLHEKSHTAKFLSKYSLESFANVKGTEVVIVKQTKPGSTKSWLAISI